MGADGLHSAVLEEDDLVQPFHRRNAVGDEQGGLSGPALFQVVQNDLLRPGVHRRDGVIKDQDGRVLQQGAGDGDALLLAARDGDAALAEDGLIAVLEIHDVVPDISETGRPLDVLRRGFVHTEGDVVGDGIREEEVVLRDIGAGLSHRADGNAVDVLSIHKEGAVGHIVGAEKQVHQRRLACAGLAHDAHALTGGDGEGDVLQHIELTIGVAEGQAAELDASLGGFDTMQVSKECYFVKSEMKRTVRVGTFTNKTNLLQHGS